MRNWKLNGCAIAIGFAALVFLAALYRQPSRDTGPANAVDKAVAVDWGMLSFDSPNPVGVIHRQPVLVVVSTFGRVVYKDAIVRSSYYGSCGLIRPPPAV